MKSGLTAGFGCGRSSSKGTLTTDTATLSLAHSTPNPKLLTILKCVLQTVITHHTTSADLFCFFGGCAPLREEQVGVDS